MSVSGHSSGDEGWGVWQQQAPQDEMTQAWRCVCPSTPPGPIHRLSQGWWHSKASRAAVQNWGKEDKGSIFLIVYVCQGITKYPTDMYNLHLPVASPSYGAICVPLASQSTHWNPGCSSSNLLPAHVPGKEQMMIYVPRRLYPCGKAGCCPWLWLSAIRGVSQ